MNQTVAKTKPYSLYILLCDGKILYTGIAQDPEARLIQHQSKKPPGAKFTRRFKKLEIVYQVEVGSRSEAQSLEYYVKKLTRKNKKALIASQTNLEVLLSKLNTRGTHAQKKV